MQCTGASSSNGETLTVGTLTHTWRAMRTETWKEESRDTKVDPLQEAAADAAKQFADLAVAEDALPPSAASL